MHRSRRNRMIAGVCGGISETTGVDVLVVRVLFAVLTMTGGAGVVLYGVGWAVLPVRDRDDATASRWALPFEGTAEQTQRLLGVGLLALGGLLGLRQVGLWFGDALMWPLVIAAIGAAVIWRHEPGGSLAIVGTGRTAVVRVGVGLLLVTAAITSFLAANDVLGAARQAAAAAVAMVAGLGFIFGPWAWRLTNELVEERRRRIRADERAELARMVHDSVLQTLTLIQRNAADPVEVAKLARRQERELRSVLYGVGVADGDRLQAALARAAAEVEDLHGVPVEVVAVGDCDLDEPVTALVLAAREALVNGAKFSGAPSLSLYAEVDGDEVTVFVRDRGKGFDPDTISSDRRGIAESIRGRVERHGGGAVLRTAAGEGTEWELSLVRERTAS